MLDTYIDRSDIDLYLLGFLYGKFGLNEKKKIKYIYDRLVRMYRFRDSLKNCPKKL